MIDSIGSHNELNEWWARFGSCADRGGLRCHLMYISFVANERGLGERFLVQLYDRTWCGYMSESTYIA
jgi:hypothetical protein